MKSKQVKREAYHGVGVLVHDQHAQVLLAQEAYISEDGTQLDDLSPLWEFGLGIVVHKGVSPTRTHKRK